MIAYPGIFVKQIFRNFFGFFFPFLVLPIPFATSFLLLSFCPIKKRFSLFFLFCLLPPRFMQCYFLFPSFFFIFLFLHRIFCNIVLFFLHFTIFCTIHAFLGNLILIILSIFIRKAKCYTKFTKLRKTLLKTSFFPKSDWFYHFLLPDKKRMTGARSNSLAWVSCAFSFFVRETKALTVNGQRLFAVLSFSCFFT